MVRVFAHGAMLIGWLSPRSVRHQPCGTAAASVAKSRWNAGSPREAGWRPGARCPRGAPHVCHSAAGACLGWPSTSNNRTRCSLLASGGRHVAGRVVRVEVILLVRRKIRDDAWPIAFLQHVFAVVSAVDLNPWFHKMYACDAVPADDHYHRCRRFPCCQPAAHHVDIVRFPRSPTTHGNWCKNWGAGQNFGDTVAKWSKNCRQQHQEHVRKRLSSSFQLRPKLGLVIGSTCWPPSHPLGGSQCLKFAGAFNSHVSPVTQFFCSFGSKSNLWSVPSRISRWEIQRRTPLTPGNPAPCALENLTLGNPAPSACINRPQAPLEFCLPFPVRFWLKSDHVRTVSKKKDFKNWAERTQDSHHNRRWQVLNMFGDGSCREVFTWDGSPEMVLLGFQATSKHKPHTVLTTVLKFPKIPQNTAHNSHHCLQLREKCHEPQRKTTHWCSKILKNTTTKHGKNDNLMSKIDQKRVQNFQKSIRQQEISIHLIRTLSFFPKKKW